MHYSDGKPRYGKEVGVVIKDPDKKLLGELRQWMGERKRGRPFLFMKRKNDSLSIRRSEA